MNIKSAMCVPLYDNREIIGIIYADRIAFKKHFVDEDLELLTLLGNLAAVKIENAKAREIKMDDDRKKQQLELAAQVQQNFLPQKKPECAKFEIAGKIIPCEEVSGDYYDFIDIDERRMAVTIADVSGKGVSAALLMAELRASLHTQVGDSYDINEMADKPNRLVHGSTAANEYITFFYGELDKENGEFRYINAGHFPPIVLDKKGEIVRLESCGYCLGMFSSSGYD
jgi:sigma-B regulation protein RsbU (phosphoserine phosphatase)